MIMIGNTEKLRYMRYTIETRALSQHEHTKT